MKQVNIPIFVPHKGCPHDCVFCNQKTITGVQDDLSYDHIYEIIDEHLSTIDHGSTEIEIAFFGGSFTGIPKSEQISYLEIAKEYLDDKRIDGIRISTRPDYINEKILDFLKTYGVTTIELGVQSLNDRVLKKSRRGHTIEDVIRASNLIKFYEFRLGLQMMVGLPGDHYNTTYKTAEKIISLKPDIVRIYPTIVFKGTQLCEMFLNGTYKPISLEEAVDFTADLLQLFYANNIKVIRVGLQATEDLISGSEIVAGPYHPAFKHLVESRMFRNAVEENIGVFGQTEITIEINKRDLSNLMGQHNDNMKYFSANFPNTEIKIIENNLINRYNYCIIYHNSVEKYTIY